MLNWAALRRWGQRLCGWFLLYVVVGGFFGLFAGAKTSDCTPFFSTFSVFSELESKCSNHNVGLPWFIAFGIPRFLIEPPAILIAMLKASIGDGSFSVLFHLFAFISSFILFPPAAWIGYRYWRAKSRFFAIGLVVSLLAEILVLAMME